MGSTYFFFLILIASSLSLISAEPDYVYTIQHLRSFNRNKMSANLGCNHTSILYGTFTYPMGLKDALFVYMNQGTYQSYISCSFKQVYARLFGTEQNYGELLKNDPATVADKARQMISRINPHYVVDWKCPLDRDTEKARQWLNKFVDKLSPNAHVYVKAPASYFCYQVKGERYLLDLGRVTNFIVQMYGEEPGVYTSYEEMLEKEKAREGQNKEMYLQNCGKYPAYKTLVEGNPSKQFYIGKTLLKEESGFIGHRFSKYLERVGDAYNNPVFLDSFPEQIIQL